MQAVQSVTFPALAKIKDDAPKFAESYRQVVMVVSYVLFPVMLGMSAVAHDMFAVLLGEEWMPTVPYFETVCLVGLFYPMSIIAYNVLKVKSGGALIVKLEIVKKVIMTLVFAVTIPISVQAVVWGLVVIAFCEMSVNFLATTKFTSLSPGRFVRTLLPPLLAAAADVRRGAADGPRDSGACPAAADGRSDGGAVSYVLLSALFRLEAFREVAAIVRKQFLHR